MTTISELYGIEGPLPFIDVHIDHDNRLFVDPHAIRLLKTPLPFAQLAIESIDSFCEELLYAARAGTSESRRIGLQLLRGFPEPWETRLGMSSNGFYGHGGAAQVGSWIWYTLERDVPALISICALSKLEELPLFVEGVGDDLTSDLTTRIIYGPLAVFTQRMLEEYPQFTSSGTSLERVRAVTWNATAREWTEEEFNLPSVDQKPLLLVPKGWARPRLLMTPERYHGTSILSYVQNVEALYDDRGKIVKTPKAKLRKRSDLKRVRPTNRLVTLGALERDVDLLRQFTGFVADRFRPAS